MVQLARLSESFRVKKNPRMIPSAPTTKRSLPMAYSHRTIRSREQSQYT